MSVGDMAVPVTAQHRPADPPNLKGTFFARGHARQQLDLKELDRYHDGERDRP